MITESDPSVRRLKIKEKLSVGERLLRSKKAAHWTKEELDGIDLSEETEAFGSRISYARWDIVAYGDDALSHLCLEGYSHNALIREKIIRISALEAMLKGDGKSSIYYTSNVRVGDKTVLGRLALFHQRLVAEQTAQTSPSSPSS